MDSIGLASKGTSISRRLAGIPARTTVFAIRSGVRGFSSTASARTIGLGPFVRSAKKVGRNGLRDFGDPQSVVAVDDDGLASGNHLAIQEQFNRVVHLAIQLD